MAGERDGAVSGYRPIACGLHDELQLLALKGRPVVVAYRDEGGALRQVTARPLDVSTRDGAEWLALDSGAPVRLDRLVEVDGRPFGPAC